MSKSRRQFLLTAAMGSLAAAVAPKLSSQEPAAGNARCSASVRHGSSGWPGSFSYDIRGSRETSTSADERCRARRGGRQLAQRDGSHL